MLNKSQMSKIQALFVEASDEQMQEIATMINMRWPKPADQPSTWQEILNHHNQKLREQKEAIKKAQVEAARRQQEISETIKTCAIIFCVLLVAIFLFAVMFMTIARSVEGEGYDYSRTVFSLEDTASLHDAS